MFAQKRSCFDKNVLHVATWKSLVGGVPYLFISPIKCYEYSLYWRWSICLSPGWYQNALRNAQLGDKLAWGLALDCTTPDYLYQ